MMKRVIILVLDSLGIGEAPDAKKFGDSGADTFGHIAKSCHEARSQGRRTGDIHLPHLTEVGLFHASRESTGQFAPGFDPAISVTGAYGFACELSCGKDTPSGHWEMAGVPVLREWGYFPETENSFPEDLLERLVMQTGVDGVLGNCHASGTEIIARLGETHIRTGKPIVYTSADSVFQIACHEESFGLNRLYEVCHIARELLEPYNIGRVIARPFTGNDAMTFQRTGNRRDYALEPPEATVLDKLIDEGGKVISVGKIADIFAQRGISEKVKATGLESLFDSTIEALQSAGDRTILFTNFVDFDSSYGHRRDVQGYATALEYFDSRLPEITGILQQGDMLILTADHGCDPTFPGSDHTRENIPVLVSGPGIKPVSLGRRNTFADIGQTIADYLDLDAMSYGKSFKSLVLD